MICLWVSLLGFRQGALERAQSSQGIVLSHATLLFSLHVDLATLKVVVHCRCLGQLMAHKRFSANSTYFGGSYAGFSVKILFFTERPRELNANRLLIAWHILVAYFLANVGAGGCRNCFRKTPFGKPGLGHLSSGADITGRPGDHAMEIDGGGTVSYLTHTPRVPLFMLVSIGLEANEFLDFQGRQGITSIARWNPMWERAHVGFGGTGRKCKNPSTKQCAWRKHGLCETRVAEACPPQLWL